MNNSFNILLKHIYRKPQSLTDQPILIKFRSITSKTKSFFVKFGFVCDGVAAVRCQIKFNKFLFKLSISRGNLYF